MATTRMEIDADEVQQLKALVAEQQERLDALERQVETPNGGETKDKRSTRRQLLKLAGATLAGAAGSAALRAIPAAAADGNTVTVGNSFTETLGNATVIDARTAPSGTAILGAHAPGWGVWAYSNSTGGQALHANNLGGGTAVVAYSNNGTGKGVLTFGDGYGVHASGATGVAAFGTYSGVFAAGNPGLFATTGVAYSRAMYGYANGSFAVGVQARSISGLGGAVRGTAGLLVRGDTFGGTYTYAVGSGYPALLARALGGGPDAVLDGTGRLVQYNGLAGGTGAPNFSPNLHFFESMRASDGALWISGATTGTPQSRWKRVNAVRVDTADGTGAPFAPFRLKDTRTGAKPAANSVTHIVVAPSGSGASAIPSDAVAIIGNLTATGYTGTGFLTISPDLITVGTSSVNFITGQAAIANSFIVGLNGGKVQVKVSGHASHFLVDITGYLQ